MTPARKRFLRAVVRLTKKQGFPPTIRELCDALGYRSTNAAAEMREKLAQSGHLTFRGFGARTLRLTEAGQAVLS